MERFKIQSFRDRFVRFGPTGFSNSELLALLLGTGAGNTDTVQLAHNLLDNQLGLVGVARLHLMELSLTDGIGLAKAVQIQVALELGKRLSIESIDTRAQISSPADAAQYFMADMTPLEQEHFRVLLLDTRNRVMGSQEVYKGNLNTSTIRTAEVFREAIRRNSAGIIIAHNHPSGDPSPSPEDVSVTRAIVQAGKLLDIEVLDHLVIGQGRFVSLKERGLGFS